MRVKSLVTYVSPTNEKETLTLCKIYEVVKRVSGGVIVINNFSEEMFLSSNNYVEVE